MSTNNGNNQPSVQQLQEEIRRLNAALARRQRNEPLAEQIETRSSLSQQFSRDMPPLLAEYEALLTDYDKQSDRVQELKQALEMLLQDQKLAESAAVEDNLQQQLAQALIEKEQSFELYQRAQTEVDRLANEVTALRNGSGIDQLEAVHTAQSSQLQLELERVRNDNNNLRNENAQLTKSNRQLRDELQSIASNQSNASAGELRRLNSELLAADERLQQAQNKFSIDKQNLESRIIELQDRLADAELAASQAAEQVRDAVATAELAVEEKNDALIDCSQRKSECERLQSAINQLVEDAGARTREEVAAVRAEANERIEALTEEVNQSELAVAEARAESERARNDKRKAEIELDRINRDYQQRSSTESASKEDQQRRLLTAERERDALQMRYDSLNQERKREEFTWRSQLTQLTSELTNVKEQLASVSGSLERSQAERDLAIQRAEEAENKYNAAKGDCQLAERKLKVQLDQAEQEAQMQLAELEIKRTAESDTYRSTVSSLRSLLVAQQRLAARWKEEASGLAERMERMHDDKRSEIARLQQRADELSQLLRNCRQQLEESEASLKEKDRAVRRLEERIGDMRHSKGSVGKRRHLEFGGGGGGGAAAKATATAAAAS